MASWLERGQAPAGTHRPVRAAIVGRRQAHRYSGRRKAVGSLRPTSIASVVTRRAPLSTRTLKAMAMPRTALAFTGISHRTEFRELASPSTSSSPLCFPMPGSVGFHPLAFVIRTVDIAMCTGILFAIRSGPSHPCAPGAFPRSCGAVRTPQPRVIHHRGHEVHGGEGEESHHLS